MKLHRELIEFGKNCLVFPQSSNHELGKQSPAQGQAAAASVLRYRNVEGQDEEENK